MAEIKASIGHFQRPRRPLKMVEIKARDDAVRGVGESYAAGRRRSATQRSAIFSGRLQMFSEMKGNSGNIHRFSSAASTAK